MREESFDMQEGTQVEFLQSGTGLQQRQIESSETIVEGVHRVVDSSSSSR